VGKEDQGLFHVHPSIHHHSYDSYPLKLFLLSHLLIPVLLNLGTKGPNGFLTLFTSHTANSTLGGYGSASVPQTKESHAFFYGNTKFCT